MMRWVGRALAAMALLVACCPAHAAVSADATALRLGVTGDVTRLVVDLDRPVIFRSRLAGAGRQLLIDLPEIGWRVGRLPRPTGLVGRQQFRELGAGASRLIVTLVAPARVTDARLLTPSGDSRRWRLVVDLVADGLVRPIARVTVAVSPLRPVPRPAVPEAEERAVAVAEPPPLVLAALPQAAAPLATGAMRRPVLVIDPGHGGIDPGAIGVNGISEKEIVLATARTLRQRLAAAGRYEVVLTRDDDRFLRLRERIARAREAGASLLISLHADSAAGTRARGVSVYTLSTTASDEEAARLASKENKSDILAGADLSHHDSVVASILIDLAQRDTNNRSIAFADLLTEELASEHGLVHRARRFAGFAVLRSPDVPSVLLELGYLSDHADALNLARDDYRARLVEAIVRAVDRWFSVDDPIASSG